MNWWLIRRRRINAQPPAVLTGATWAIDGDGRAYNTPTLGSELLANGDFSAWTGDNPTEWTIGSEAAPDTEITQRGSGQAHSGSGTGSANFFSSTGAGVYAFQSPVATVGRWYVVAATVSVIGAGNVGWRWGFTSPLAMQMFTTTNYAVTARSLSSQFTIIRSGGAFDVTIDGISLKQLTTANLFAYTQDIDYPTGPPTVRINTMVTGTQAGVIGWVDDPGNPQNGISAICNGGGSIDLIKLVAGTYTQLQSISSAHVADAPIQIKRTAATTFRVWHNGSAIGADQTISDSAIVDNAEPFFGAISTHPGNLFSAGNGFTLNGLPYSFPGA